MQKDDFLMRLTAASYWAWRAMQRYVIDKLPPEFRYDLVPRNGPRRENESADSKLEAKDVVDKIMKDDKVPVWIDIMVDRIEKGTTVFAVECSERYESDESQPDYTWSGTAPFGIKCTHFPKSWLKMEFRGVAPKMKFRLCLTFWNRIADFILLRWLFCRLDSELVAFLKKQAAKHVTKPEDKQ